MKKTKDTWVPDSSGMADEEAYEVENKKNQNMKKSKVIFFGIVIIIVIVLAIWAGIMIAGSQSGSNPNAMSPYSAVELSTGDIYFGKLSWFPSPHMTNVWFIQRSQNQSGQVQTSLAPMKSLVWGPADEINFNPQDIVFSTRLLNSSQVVQAIENPSAMSQQQNPNGYGTAPSTMPQAPTGPAPTSTK